MFGIAQQMQVRFAPRIERYAWFSGRFEWIPYIDLLGADGQLTPLGQAYVSAPTNPDCGE